ncbi:MAG: hypothetical protein AAF462_11805 [Thermodesulfobacteriota bacterium]
MNKYLKNFLLAIFTIVIALVAVEFLSRLFFDPIDFLKPNTIQDEVLRYRIEPGSGAHDSWGYRNKTVPDSADIVTIGDSHTYGVSATAANSWPSSLSRISGKNIYNLSLGGYGPAEYLYLMENKALNLNPELIIVGFYLGNDLKDSLTAVYTVPIWEALRTNSEIKLEDVQKNNKPNKKGLTDWLSANSVLYRIISSSAIGDNLRQQRRLDRGEEILMLQIDEIGINTGFTPDRRLKGLDLGTPEIREGLKLSLSFLNKMNQLAKDNDTEFLVVILPTKENVYSDFINQDQELSQSEKLKALITNEEIANQFVRAFFDANSISYIDMLEPLKNAAQTQQIYPNNFGGHSNKNGYEIIADNVGQHIQAENSD